MDDDDATMLINRITFRTICHEQCTASKTAPQFSSPVSIVEISGSWPPPPPLGLCWISHSLVRYGWFSQLYYYSGFNCLVLDHLSLDSDSSNRRVNCSLANCGSATEPLVRRLIGLYSSRIALRSEQWRRRPWCQMMMVWRAQVVVWCMACGLRHELLNHHNHQPAAAPPQHKSTERYDDTLAVFTGEFLWLCSTLTRTWILESAAASHPRVIDTYKDPPERWHWWATREDQIHL